MFLRETMCSERERIFGAIFPGIGSTGGIIAPASPSGRKDADEHASRDPLGLERPALREEVWTAEGGQRPARIADEDVALFPDRPDEQKLAPLELGDREASLGVPHVGERLRVVQRHPPSAAAAAEAAARPGPRVIFRAMCSSRRTSLGVRSARSKRARHSRK